MLALWEFFWTEADWTGAPPAPTPAPATVQAESRGGGHKRENDRLGSDYWDVRERYLRRFAKPLVEAISKSVEVEEDNSTRSIEGEKLDIRPRAEIDSHLLLRQQALVAALQAAYTAQTQTALRDAMQRATQLHLDISNLQQQHYNRAIALLLLDAF